MFRKKSKVIGASRAFFKKKFYQNGLEKAHFQGIQKLTNLNSGAFTKTKFILKGFPTKPIQFHCGV